MTLLFRGRRLGAFLPTARSGGALLLLVSVFLGGCRSAPGGGEIEPAIDRAEPRSARAGRDLRGADLYFDFTLIDPASEAVIHDAWVVVTDGRISEIGSGAPPRAEFDTRWDLDGRYGLPGLVDAHAHVTAGPHTIELVDGSPLVTMKSDDEITRFNGRAALASGVTTLRNPGGDPEAHRRYDRRIADGAWIGPEAVHAGAIVQPPPFGGGAFVYPETEGEWRAEARRQADLGMKYFKLYVSLAEDELEIGIRVAHEHGMRAIAHLDRVSWSRAIELGIDDLTHALPTSPELIAPERRDAYVASLGPDSKFMYRWFEAVDIDDRGMQELVARLARERVRVDLTLVVNELVYNADDLARVTPPGYDRFVHPAVRRASEAQLATSTTGWTDEDFERARAVMPKVLEFARRLHEAGVPLMIGTDGHGGTPLYARELELHSRAGISTWDVLRMSTSEGARLLDLGERTGRFEIGFEADMVFLDADPLADVGAVRNLHLVVTDGEAHRVATLMADDAEPAAGAR